MKASDISDEQFLGAVRAVAPNRWAMGWEVANLLGVPWKVSQAKARKLIKRGLLGGCACGCRGDYHVLAPGQKNYEPPYNPVERALG